MESYEAHYWQACARGVLPLQSCGRCGQVQFPPSSRCRACLADELSWVETAGGATVETFSTVHRAPTPAFAVHAPYTVAVVRLDEGPLMQTWLLDEAEEPLRQGVAVGVRTRLVFRELNGRTVPMAVVSDTGAVRAVAP